MIFPLWKFWTYSPLGLLAAVLWNACEILRVRCPFAPQVFGAIIGRSPRAARTKAGEPHEQE